jgi:hypothetical protein
VIERVVSGGQTGVDRGALDAALAAGVACGGWCPKDRRAEDGTIPAKYPLKEMSSTDYRDRTLRNVQDSDGTLILMTERLSGGTALTREFALAQKKPLMLVDLDRPLSPDAVLHWATKQGIRVLNVAGPRESLRPGIQQRAAKFVAGMLAVCRT